jgi:transposase-like protein
MPKKDENEVEAASADVRRGFVYIPCPACGKPVLISEVGRISDDPPTFECRSCGAYLVVE